MSESVPSRTRLIPCSSVPTKLPAPVPSESKPSKSNNAVVSSSWYLSINNFSFSLSTCAALFVELVCPEKSDRVVTSNKNLSPLLSIPSCSTLSSLSESITEVPDESTPLSKIIFAFWSVPSLALRSNRICDDLVGISASCLSSKPSSSNIALIDESVPSNKTLPPTSWITSTLSIIRISPPIPEWFVQ